MVRGGRPVALGARIVPALAALALGPAAGCFVDPSGLRGPGRGDDAGPDGDADSDLDGDGDADGDTDGDPDRDAVGDADASVDGDPDVDRDAEPTCSLADERCEENVRRYCEGTVLQSEDCGASSHCDDGTGAPLCVSNVCTPDTSRCSSDATVALVCDSRGATETTVPCSRGCAGDACRPETPCGEAIFATMSSGSVRVDLCGAGSDQSHTEACGWASQSVPGEDVLIRIEVDRRRDLRIQAHQVSAGETIDPTLHLRSVCEDIDSEIWCREDTDGQDEDFTVTFDPGDYFLVVDRHERVGTSCGVLEVTIAPL